MIRIDDDEVLNSTVNFSTFYRAEVNVPFTEEKFLNKALPKLSKSTGRKYPYQVKIPKSIRELTQGDLEPAKVIEITEPIMGPYGEMWFGDATKGVRLLAGYKDGDSRYVCDYELGEKDIHGLLAGSTGQGKSVTLNAYIYGMCYYYAPWEIDLTLCDAKIVEFKTIAIGHPMPHISSVAATGDADYLISVLQTKCDEMLAVNKMFSAMTKYVGDVKNIADFRKKTGLVLPQNVIIIDEFQTMFKEAKKKAGQIISILDSFARLGRNTGYHLLMASQEIGSDVPKGMLTNIKLRMSMGAFAQVSEQVLGNPEAAYNMGKRGHLIINNEPSIEKNADHNVQFRVPFPDDECRSKIAHSTIELAKKMGYSKHMNFYDEEDLVQEAKLEEYLKSFEPTPNQLLLGEPSFVMKSAKKMVALKYTGEGIETLGVIAPTDELLARFVKLIMANLKVAGNSKSVVLCAHPPLNRATGLSDFAMPNFYFTEPQYEDNTFFTVMRSIIYKRKLMLKADANIFAEGSTKQYNEKWAAAFEQYVGKDSKYDTELNRERFVQYLAIMTQDKQIMTGLKLDGGKITETHYKFAASCVQMCDQYGAGKIEITLKKMPILYYWIVGLDSIVGLGRMTKSKFVSELSIMMIDAGPVNVRVLTFTTSYADLTDIASATRWFIVDRAPESELNKIKCTCYPDTVLPVLSVVYDSTDKNNGCFKFKKFVQEGEIL